MSAILYGSGGISAQGPAFIQSLPGRLVQGQRQAVLLATTAEDEAIFWACPVSFGVPTFRLGESFLLGGMRHVGDWTVAIGGVSDLFQLWVSNQVGLGFAAPIEVRTS